MAKTLTLKQTGYWVEGTARIRCWDGEEGDVNMDPFHVDSLDEIPDRINDGQFGCEAILAAECIVHEDYQGTHVFLEVRNYDRDQIGMNAPRGVKGEGGMKEITVRLYDYDELSEEAKKKAHEDWLSQGHEHFWGGEVRDTLKKLEEEFGIEVTRWSYDSCSHDVGTIRFKRYNDDQLALTGIRAQAFLWNNFGHLIMQPRAHYYMKIDGKWRNCVGQDSRRYESKVFFDRTYDGTCPLTGVCFDNDALDPLAYFCFGVMWSEEAKKRVMIPQSRRMRWGVTTVEDVLRACVDSLFESAQQDCEYQESEEYFSELCENNGWTFEEDGERRDAA